MKMNDYQKEALKTAQFPKFKKKWVYPVIGLTGEAGEVAEKFKKIIRDKKGRINEFDKLQIVKELGDVLWYIAIISDTLGVSLEDVSRINITKLKSRQKRNKIKGQGDER